VTISKFGQNWQESQCQVNVEVNQKVNLEANQKVKLPNMLLELPYLNVLSLGFLVIYINEILFRQTCLVKFFRILLP